MAGLVIMLVAGWGLWAVITRGVAHMLDTIR